MKRMLTMNPKQSNSGALMECEVADMRPHVLEVDCNLSLLLFGGKGGVGKTTCAAAAALHLAGQFPDRTYLIASTDPAHSLSDSLAGSSLPSNLKMLEIDARESLKRFKEAHGQHLQGIARRGTFLDDEDIEQLLELSMPGLDEVMAFNEISALVEDQTYSCIIIDTAPTGYTLRFLGLSNVLCNWLNVLDAMLAKHRYMVKVHHGFYHKEGADLFLEELATSIERLASLLGDPQRCLFVPVTLAECLATDETLRLVHELERMKIPIKDILVNRIYPAQGACPVCRDVRKKQDDELCRIREVFASYVLWSIPFQAPEVRGAVQLRKFFDGIRTATCPASPGSEMGLVFPRQTDCRTTIGEKAALTLGIEHPAGLPASTMCLLLFAGKGGVGKTTLASATALRLAREYRGKEVFLFSTDPAHSLSDCLEMPVGPQQVRICEGLTAMEINAEAEFEKLRTQYAGEIEDFFDSLTGQSTMDLAFDQDVIERIMDLSPPGLDEVMALTRVLQFLEAGKYDIFVFDTAPTGHLIRLLELPALIQDWLKVFFGMLLKYKNVFRIPKIADRLVTMSKQIKVWRSLLMDPRKGGIHVVTIPTEMAFEETCDLVAVCQHLNIHVPAMFVNLATPLDGCPLCNTLAHKELTVREKFGKSFRSIHQTVVYRCEQPQGLERLAELGKALYRG